MTDNAAALTRLYIGLRGRVTPEQVLATVCELDVLHQLPAPVRDQATRLAAGAGRSRMNDTYRHHPGLDRAYATAKTAIDHVCDTLNLEPLPDTDPNNPTELAAFTAAAHALLGIADETENPVKRTRTVRWTTRTNGYDNAWSITYRNGARGRRGDTHGHPTSRLTAEQRRDLLPGVSTRAYRRAVNAVNHLHQRTAVLAAERDRETATAFAKSRLATTITADDFTADPATAAFVAYYVARLGLRTVFTNTVQTKPMDTIGEALLDAALTSPTNRPAVIARVLTRQQILNLLTETEKGELLGVYAEHMAAFARVLERCHDPLRNLHHMVARPGDDSSSWNIAARAFNQARTGWLNLTQSLHLDTIVETPCPGKVPSLIAADVAAWRHHSDSADNRDGAVFADLPLPWDVVLHGVDCPADLVRTVCARHDIDADTTGWTAAYQQQHLEQPAVTPELVHGVAVTSPALAEVMRKTGFYSGATTGHGTHS